MLSLVVATVLLANVPADVQTGEIPDPPPPAIQDSPSPPGTKYGIGTGGLRDKGYAPGGSKCTLNCDLKTPQKKEQ